MRTTVKLMMAMLALTLLLAACGSDDDSDSTTAGTSAAPTTTAGSSASGGGYDYGGSDTTASSSGTTIKLADTKLGKVLTDGEGRTVYVFDADQTGQPSACAGQCAANWPVVTTTDKATAGDGIDADDLGTAATADGGKQVTYYGHRLYRFAADTAAGDTKGQGVAGKWHVVNAEGDPVM